MASAIRWTFFRAGGFDQVKLASGEDLNHLDQLDQKLWVALACPTGGLEVDSRTLALIDSDNDGRVRAPELIAAAKFACAHLKHPDDLLKGRASLPLRSINDKTEEGQALLGAAKQVLVNLGKPDDSALSADDLTDPARMFADRPFNGDGVITESSSEDEFIRSVIRDVMDCIGSDPDRSGKPGVNREKVDAFFDELRAYSTWQTAGSADPNIWPLGRENTTAAAAAVAAVRTKVDDYFARCRLVAFDPRLSQLLNRREEEYLELAARDLSPTASEAAGFPLAQVGPGRSLPLLGGVNPAHAGALKALQVAAVSPLLGSRELLSESDWLTMAERLKPFETWVAAKQGLRVEKLGEPRIAEVMASKAEATLTELIAKDQALEAEAARIENVERLVRYHRDLYRICTNFVSFEHFYGGEDSAVFQCGTLYVDQRACRLCLRVTDPARHASVAGLAGAYLAYADCTRPASGEKMQIVAVVTNGDSDRLMVGRNGLFYDRQGRDWDATITKVVDKPISLRGAFWAPYKKFARMIEEQVAKRASAADSESTASLDAAATNTVNTDRTATKSAEPKKMDVGSVAALGVAVGALGAFLTALVGYATGVLKLGVLATVGAILGFMLLISLPSVVLAFVTLRKRNLGPILDACGWAVNAHARINVPFGATLTSLARLPPGSRRSSRDRYPEKGLSWKRYALLALVLLLGYRWYQGTLDRFLPESVRASRVLGSLAPERPAPVPAVTPPPPQS
jgi:hypothetical protein